MDGDVRREKRGIMERSIIPQLSPWQELGPRSRHVHCKAIKIKLNHLVDNLCLPITLRVVCGAHHQSCYLQTKYFLPKWTEEVWVMIRHNEFRNAMEPNNFFYKLGSHRRCCKSIRQCNKVSLFWWSINYNKYYCFTIRTQKTNNNIHRNFLPYNSWNR